MTKLKLKTVLFMLKETDYEIQSYARDILSDQYYSKETSKLIASLVTDENDIGDRFSELLDCKDVDEKQAGDLIIAISEVRNTKQMSIESIMEMYRSGDEFLEKSAKQCIVNCYSMYVYDLIHKTYPTYATKYVEELYQSGIEGLLKSMDNYNPKLGEFTTHCKRYVLHELSRQINFHNNDATPHFYGIQKQISDAISLLHKNGVEVTEQRIQILTNLKPDIIKRELDYMNHTNFRYIDDENDTSLQEIEDDYGMSPEKIVTNREKADSLYQSVEALGEKERDIIQMKFWDGKTNEEIAADLTEKQNEKWEKENEERIKKNIPVEENPPKAVQIGEVKTLCNMALRELRKDPNLRSFYTDYQTKADSTMKQCVIPVMPSDEQAEMEMDDLAAVAELLSDVSVEFDIDNDFSFNLPEKENKDSKDSDGSDKKQ